MSFVIGSKAYLGLGHNATNPAPNGVWEYDPATNAYTQKADYPGASIQGNITFSIGSKGYVGMGVTSAYTNDFYEYDPATNTWTAKASFPGAARANAFTFSINGKGYMGAGHSNSGLYNDFWEYNPAANAWTQKTSYPGTPRWGVAAFSIGNMGYACTGQSAAGDHADVYQYNATTDTWTQKSNFRGYARGQAVGFSIGGLGYIGTGSDYTSTLRKDFWQYNAANDTWMQKADFGGLGRWLATGFSTNKKGYIGLGWRGNFANDLWEYQPDSLQASYYNPATICGGTIIPVSILSGITFNPGNVFTIQLSDAGGSFTSPVSIGTLADTVGGVVSVTIPANTPAGTGYRIRVVSSSPVVVGANSGDDLTINPVTTPTLSISTPSTTVCSSTTIGFNATATNQGVPNYYWKVNGVVTGPNAGWMNLTPANGDVIVCMMTIPLVCTTEDTLISNSITMTVTPRVTPSITVNVPTTSVCSGDTAHFVATAVNGGAAPTYQWQVNATLMGANSPLLDYAPANGDLVFCRLTSNEACTTSSTATGNASAMVVNPRPVTPIITHTGNTLSTGIYASYQWFLNGTAIPGATTQSIVLQQNGSYSVTVTDGGQCSTGSAVLPVGGVGVGATPVHATIRVFPNPVQEAVYITAPFAVHAVLKDIVGRTLIMQSNAARLDVHALPAGHYLLELTDQDGRLVHTARIVK